MNVIPMKQRPEGVTVRGWLEDQIADVSRRLDAANAEQQAADKFADMRDEEYEMAKKEASLYEKEHGHPDPDLDKEEAEAYDRLSEANRDLDRKRIATRRLGAQLDFMQEKVKFMPADF